MIALASDHGGYDLKAAVARHLEAKGISCKDYGCYDRQSCDYPDFGKAAAAAVADGECEKGILICTTGIGISIAANKVPGIRCAFCTEPYLAKMTRAHNNANMLALGGGITGVDLACAIVDTFLETPFSGEEKHQKRIDKIEQIYPRK